MVEQHHASYHNQDGFFRTLFNLKSYTCRHSKTFSGSRSTGGILRQGYGSSGSGTTLSRGGRLYFALATSAKNLIIMEDVQDNQ